MRLKKAGCELKGDLVLNERCPKCTLIPPCSHFESRENLFEKKLFKRDDWLLMT